MSTVVNVERYSTLIKFLRVSAYVQRFIRNLQCIRGGRQVNLGLLSVQEIEIAEQVWIQDSQKRLRDSEDYRVQECDVMNILFLEYFNFGLKF